MIIYPRVVSQSPSTDGAVLEAKGLSKRYGDRVALSDVSFNVRAGELVACIGPNGAGKTTLLSILADIKQPDAGAVRRPQGAVGWVPQEPALYGKLSVAENLRLFARLEGIGDVEAAVARMLDQAGLEERANEPVERLSGGNRQRVNIAIGLLADAIGSAARRTELRSRPASAGAAVGLHQRTGELRHDRRLRDSRRFRGGAVRRPGARAR